MHGKKTLLLYLRELFAKIPAAAAAAAWLILSTYVVFTWRMKPHAVTTIASRKPNGKQRRNIRNKLLFSFFFFFKGSISFWSSCDVIYFVSVWCMYTHWHTQTPRLYTIHSVYVAYEMRLITPSERDKNSAQKKSMNVNSKQNEKNKMALCFLCVISYFVYTRCWSARSHCEVVDPRHISFSSLVDTQRQKAPTLTAH